MSRLRRRTTDHVVPPSASVLIDTAEMSARMIEAIGMRKRAKGESAVAFVERCLDLDEKYGMILIFSKVAAKYLSEQLMSTPGTTRERVPIVSDKAQ